MTRLSNRRGHFGKDHVSCLSITDRYVGIRRVTLSFGYVQKIVVMHACMRSVANEQLRETRLVIITPGRLLRVAFRGARSEEHTSELQSHLNLVCRLLLEKK